VRSLDILATSVPPALLQRNCFHIFALPPCSPFRKVLSIRNGPSRYPVCPSVPAGKIQWTSAVVIFGGDVSQQTFLLSYIAIPRIVYTRKKESEMSGRTSWGWPAKFTATTARHYCRKRAMRRMTRIRKDGGIRSIDRSIDNKRDAIEMLIPSA